MSADETNAHLIPEIAQHFALDRTTCQVLSPLPTRRQGRLEPSQTMPPPMHARYLVDPAYHHTSVLPQNRMKQEFLQQAGDEELEQAIQDRMFIDIRRI